MFQGTDEVSPGEEWGRADSVSGSKPAGSLLWGLTEHRGVWGDHGALWSPRPQAPPPPTRILWETLRLHPGGHVTHSTYAVGFGLCPLCLLHSALLTSGAPSGLSCRVISLQDRHFPHLILESPKYSVTSCWEPLPGGHWGHTGNLPTVTKARSGGSWSGDTPGMGLQG